MLLGGDKAWVLSGNYANMVYEVNAAKSLFLKSKVIKMELY